MHPVSSPMSLAFDPQGRSRHFRKPHTPLRVGKSISGLNYGSPSLRPVELLAPLTELTRFSPSRRALLRPGFRRIGRPLRRRISLQWQLCKFHWRDFRPLERQLASLHPQGGLEPATLRLTARKDGVSRGLPAFAPLCRTVRRAPKNLRLALCRSLPPFAGLCCSERARKGQRSDVGKIARRQELEGWRFRTRYNLRMV